MEADIKPSTEVSQKSVEPISFFDDNDDFVLAYKKTEKLASAVYMVTGLFSDSEPMKWTLRKKSGELLSFILTYKDTAEGGRGDFVSVAKTMTLELVSFLEISLRGGLVSQMNFSVLKHEFINLISILVSSNSLSNTPTSEGISKAFFDTEKNYPSTAKELAGSERIYKTAENTVIDQRLSLIDIKDRHLNESKDNLKKTNRQNIILNLIRKKKELTIKDISLVIKDCSEKTIQRELNSFISAGVLKRAGVRRWSKYSINNGQ